MDAEIELTLDARVEAPSLLVSSTTPIVSSRLPIAKVKGARNFTALLPSRYVDYQRDVEPLW